MTLQGKISSFVFLAICVLLTGCDQSVSTSAMDEASSAESKQGKSTIGQKTVTASNGKTYQFILKKSNPYCKNFCNRYREWDAKFEADVIVDGVNQTANSDWTVDLLSPGGDIDVNCPVEGVGGTDGHWLEYPGDNANETIQITAEFSNSNLGIDVTLSEPASFSLNEAQGVGRPPCEDAVGETTMVSKTSPTVSVSGPTEVELPTKSDPPVTKTWTADVSGGFGSTSVTWYRIDGLTRQVGTGTTYSRTYPFSGSTYDYTMTLKAEATDSQGLTSTATYDVLMDFPPHD